MAEEHKHSCTAKFFNNTYLLNTNYFLHHRTLMCLSDLLKLTKTCCNIFLDTSLVAVFCSRSQYRIWRCVLEYIDGFRMGMRGKSQELSHSL